jgi:hypothetical protein
MAFTRQDTPGLMQRTSPTINFCSNACAAIQTAPRDLSASSRLPSAAECAGYSAAK